jgi:hypothetical protein
VVSLNDYPDLRLSTTARSYDRRDLSVALRQGCNLTDGMRSCIATVEDQVYEKLHLAELGGIELSESRHTKKFINVFSYFANICVGSTDRASSSLD